MFNGDILLKLVADTLRINGPMKIMGVYKALSAQYNGLKYSKLEALIRSHSSKNDCFFKRLDRGLYGSNEQAILVREDEPVVVHKMPQDVASPAPKKVKRTIRNREKLKGFIVSDNLKNRKKVVALDAEFKVEQHLGFLKTIAINIGEKFGQDVNECFSEIVSIAYDEKHKYDPKKGSPTTFILNQVAPRLRNRVSRDFIPSIHRQVEVIGEDGIAIKESKRIKVPHCSLSSKVMGMSGKDVELVEIINEDMVDATFDKSVYRPDRDTEQRNVADRLRAIMQECKISDREMLVIEKRFGLDGSPERTLEEIGEEMSMTKERVRQILEKNYDKLRKNKGIQELVA